jgi:hypothetical protein
MRTKLPTNARMCMRITHTHIDSCGSMQTSVAATYPHFHLESVGECAPDGPPPLLHHEIVRALTSEQEVLKLPAPASASRLTSSGHPVDVCRAPSVGRTLLPSPPSTRHPVHRPLGVQSTSSGHPVARCLDGVDTHMYASMSLMSVPTQKHACCSHG